MRQSVRARRTERNHRRNRGAPKLNLVSLMDIFTILVFFLLVNSSDVEVLQSNKAIKLPESVADQKPDNTLMVMVSQKDILVSGRAVATVKEVLASKEDEIAGLKKELLYQASRKPYRSPEAQALGRDVTIMGDAAIPYTLLKKIMTTCAKNEYRNISMAVSQILESSAPEQPASGGNTGVQN